MEATINDLQELKRILAAGSTPYVEALIKSEIEKLEATLNVGAAKAQQTEAKKAVPTKIYETISKYAFSDSSKKASVIIKEIKGLDQAEISFEPKERECVVCVNREKQNMSNLKLTISPLYKKIKPEESKFTKRGETLTLHLIKKKETSWMKLKKSALDQKKPKMSQTKDDKMKDSPDTALMDMMKKMYDEGDDEMKRTISKAMWEAQHKKPEDEKMKQ